MKPIEAGDLVKDHRANLFLVVSITKGWGAKLLFLRSGPGVERESGGSIYYRMERGLELVQ